MVLESLIKPLKAEKRPWEMFFYGILITSFSLFLSYWIFSEKADMIMIFLTVLACVPVMYHAVNIEERKDLMFNSQPSMLRAHAKMLTFFVFLFIGITTAMAIWYVVLPSNMSQILFNQQILTISRINSPATAQATGAFFFSKIFFNNIKVLTFCLIFSFFYGAGAIFILTWNASVVAAAIGNLIKVSVAKYGVTGMGTVAVYAQASAFSFARYFIHGIPEMLAYMVGGLAGGIISVALVQHDFRTQRFEKILLDSSNLLLIAIVIVFVAAIIEAFITPALF